MRNKKKIHIIQNCQFTNEIVSFLSDDKFPNNLFVVPGKGLKLDLIDDDRIIHHDSKILSLLVIIYMFFRAERIILHGFFYYTVLIFLIPFIWLGKKVIWITWGGDVYLKETTFLMKWIRRMIIPNIALIVGDIRGDINVVKENFNLSDDLFFKSFVYPNKLVNELGSKNQKKNHKIKFMISHSATGDNRHIDSIKLIESIRLSALYEVFLPMSYGDFDYRDEVKKYIDDNHLEGKYFVLTDFVKLHEYLSFLSTIDVAIFMSNRQIGMNNLIPLLYYGVKVYLSDKSSSWDYLREMGLNFYEISEFNRVTVTEDVNFEQNPKILNNYFNENNLLNQWNFILNFEVR